LVVLTGVAFGIVAILLTGTALSVHPSAPAVAGPVLTLEELGFAVVSLGALWLSYKIFQRLFQSPMTYPPAAIAACALLLLSMLGFYAVMRNVAPSLFLPRSDYPPSCPQANCSTGPGGGTGPATGHPTTGPTAPGFGLPTITGLPWSFPWWASYVVLLGALAIVGLLVVPALVDWWEREEVEESNAPARASPAEVRAAVTLALDELAQAHDGDPRGVIVRAYGKLLEKLLGRFNDTEPLTAREIERYCVSELGVAPATARELTELFEEARYSTRPMGPSEVDRTRSALSGVLRDLGHV
jgi:hypothetical protein